MTRNRPQRVGLSIFVASSPPSPPPLRSSGLFLLLFHSIPSLIGLKCKDIGALTGHVLELAHVFVYTLAFKCWKLTSSRTLLNWLSARFQWHSILFFSSLPPFSFLSFDIIYMYIYIYIYLLLCFSLYFPF